MAAVSRPEDHPKRPVTAMMETNVARCRLILSMISMLAFYVYSLV